MRPYFTMLGTVYHKMGRNREALFCLKEAINKLFPSYPPPYNEMARVYIEMGELTKAEEMARFVAENTRYGKDNVDALSILADIYYKKGEYGLAKEFKRKVERLKDER
jgi:tetratricopeptide (TPR) repeat protein